MSEMVWGADGLTPPERALMLKQCRHETQEAIADLELTSHAVCRCSDVGNFEIALRRLVMVSRHFARPSKQGPAVVVGTPPHTFALAIQKLREAELSAARAYECVELRTGRELLAKAARELFPEDQK